MRFTLNIYINNNEICLNIITFKYFKYITFKIMFFVYPVQKTTN